MIPYSEIVTFLYMTFRLGSKLLHLKQTLLFVVFGMIIGYISFISGTLLTSMEVIREFRSGIEKLFHESHYEKDWLYNAFIEKPEIGAKLLEQIITIIPNEQSLDFQLNLFMKKDGEEDWVMLASSERSFAGMILPNEKQVESLNRSLSEGIYIEKQLFLGQENKRSILLDITSREDDNDYVIQMLQKQGSIFNYITSEKDTIMVYGIVVLILSTFLGSFFASRLSRPIKQMADTAFSMASGHFDTRMNSRRRDDIGLLSRTMDEMAANIDHRIKSMQTMNRIDRTVLSSVSRRELLYKVAGLISDQFDQAPVTVLEKVEEAFHIIAAAPAEREIENHIIKMENVPDRLLQNMEVPFEFSIGEDTPAVMILTDKACKKVLSVPLFQDETFVGIFAISRKTFSNQDREALGMLSDQTGVALKSLHDMKRRESLYNALYRSLIRSVDAKSRWTAGHSDRVAEVADIITEKMDISDEMKSGIHMGAMLHDIGKMGVPESILDKPGRLTDAEFSIIKSHPGKGYDILKDVPDFSVIRQIVKYHHERWDGTGYPEGLAGEQIPLPARIVTIADVFDAITEDRPYRQGFSIEETLDFLKEQRGKLFDPELLDIFLKIISQ